jgi:hypothetical protein
MKRRRRREKRHVLSLIDNLPNPRLAGRSRNINRNNRNRNRNKKRRVCFRHYSHSFSKKPI